MSSWALPWQKKHMNLPLVHNGENVDPFPKLIWKFKYDFPLSSILGRIKDLATETPKNSKLESGAAFSTVAAPFDPPHAWPELADFRKWLHTPLDFLWQQNNFKQYNTGVTNSWINIHKNTGVTLEHNHNYAVFVITAYLKLPTDSGFIEFRDPLEYHKTNTPIEPEEELWKAIPCETNDVLIFPGWLKHRTQPNLTDDDRIVLTMNIG